jgi:lipopolysaccharide export system protein LptC
MTVERSGYGRRTANRPPRRLNYDPTRPIDDRAFASARRHSWLVSGLKFVLPALVVAGGVVFWASTRFIPSDLATIARDAGIDTTSETVTMNRPRISGFEGTRRAYDVQAELAVQSLNDPKVMTFHKIDASIGLDDAGIATLNAAIGVYDGNRNTLALKDGITVATDTGYSATASELAVDLGKGSLMSPVPIEIKTAQGSIRANALSVTERGKRIVFSNGVSVTFLPEGELAAVSRAR